LPAILHLRPDRVCSRFDAMPTVIAAQDALRELRNAA
jgi:hypothetical protein